MHPLLSSLLSIFFVLAVVAGAWLLLWRFVLAPNPLVRDFFDLDRADATPSLTHTPKLTSDGVKKQSKKEK
jgi:hypothetical protein